MQTDRPSSSVAQGRNFTGVPWGIAAWIILCAYLTLGGWLLSAVHQLNRIGYVCWFTIGIVVLACLFYREKWRLRDFGFHKARRRFTRLFPAAFLTLAAIAFLGGVLHPPTNYDALAYRQPRILNWLAEDQWHWIHTAFQRLNTRASGYEWVAAPLMALTRSDRALFLINIVSFLLLPGLIFGMFTQLGVRRKVAWNWMWILPSGYCYALQAGSIGNDLFGAVFAIAAVNFALRARATNQPVALYLSILSAALLSNSKLSNLPLLLPWGIALLPSLKHLPARPLLAAAAIVVAFWTSVIPNSVANHFYGKDWTGLVQEMGGKQDAEKLVRFANNAVILTIQNAVPPIFPISGTWNRTVARVMPEYITARLERNFEPGGAHWALGELEIEETAGMGFGVTMLLGASLAAAFSYRRAEPFASAATGCDLLFERAILVAAILALCAYMVSAGMTTAARLVTPYYALLVPVVLRVRGQKCVVEKRWWQPVGLAVFALAGVLLIVSPARPLWPAVTVLSQLHERYPSNSPITRAYTVYSVYGKRAVGFEPVFGHLPKDEHVIGLMSFDDPETSLWKPFGSRRVVHVMPDDSAADLRNRGVTYVLVNPTTVSIHYGEAFSRWVTQTGAQKHADIRLVLRATLGPVEWELYALPSEK